MLRTLSEKVKSKLADSLNKLIYAYKCTRHSVTSFGLYYLLFGRNPCLPIEFILNTSDGNIYEASDYQKYTKEWSEKRTEVFKTANENTKKRRDAEKKIKDQTATLAPLEMSGRVLVGNLSEIGARRASFVLEHKTYVI